jgi:glycine/D-amino acid oxidase-like deaminating enzyme
MAADWCVNAAGPASGALMRPLGIDLPVSPRKRTVFVIRAPLANAGFPMVFDTSGAWIRPEGEGFICGIVPDAANDPDATGDFEPDYALMEAVLWPALAHRIPALEQLRVERAWAGHYEVNALDHNGVIGPHDEIANLIIATGFSGHGLQHAPATGRGVAELITRGRFEAIDLSPLGYGRIRSRTPIVESIVY